MLDSQSGDTGSSPVAVINVRVVEWQTHPAKNRHTEGSTPSTDTNGGRAVPAADYVFRQLPVYILSVCFRKCLNNKNQYGDRRLMAGHQIVDLSIRVRFPSITLPAVPVSILCSGSLRFTIWFIRFRQSFAYPETHLGK